MYVGKVVYYQWLSCHAPSEQDWVGGPLTPAPQRLPRAKSGENSHKSRKGDPGVEDRVKGGTRQETEGRRRGTHGHPVTSQVHPPMSHVHVRVAVVVAGMEEPGYEPRCAYQAYRNDGARAHPHVGGRCVRPGVARLVLLRHKQRHGRRDRAHRQEVAQHQHDARAARGGVIPVSFARHVLVRHAVHHHDRQRREDARDEPCHAERQAQHCRMVYERIAKDPPASAEYGSASERGVRLHRLMRRLPALSQRHDAFRSRSLPKQRTSPRKPPDATATAFQCASSDAALGPASGLARSEGGPCAAVPRTALASG
mmetsp:Transcript_32221/g.96192  ORF Transcript_32221/g.96192 Transcript_32221/m.96192 type:complete len:312 (-) Transcript_32221:392-1327(-)